MRNRREKMKLLVDRITERLSLNGRGGIVERIVVFSNTKSACDQLGDLLRDFNIRCESRPSRQGKKILKKLNRHKRKSTKTNKLNKKQDLFLGGVVATCFVRCITLPCLCNLYQPPSRSCFP